MSVESSSNSIPEEALNAFLDGILTELRSPPDPAMLTSVRSIFRKRIPLHLRSYAAALLILRAAGMSRPQPAKATQQAAKPAAEQAPASLKRRAPERKSEAKAPKPASKENAPEASAPKAARKPAPPPLEGSVPLFVSMGRRQRLKPQELRDHISAKTGISVEFIGRVHLFDNYSFIDVKDVDAERIVAAVDGQTFNGRPLEIKPAKKKGEAPAAKERGE